MTMFTRAGVALSVIERGSGRPFVFQHGLCGDAAQPAQVFPEQSGYRCITLECRGHGASQTGDLQNFSIATFSDDLAAYLRANTLAPVALGGISMGAAIALRLAVTAPDLVGALVLARPAWLCADGPENMRPNALAGALLRDHPPAEARRLFEESELAVLLREAGPDNLASIRGFFEREPAAITAALLCRISADGPGVSEAQVRALRMPTLLIGHGRDAVHPLAYARTLADWIPGARLVEITPKARDAAAYRDDFRAALAAFFKEI